MMRGGLVDPQLKARLHATISHTASNGGMGALTGHSALIGGGFWSSLKSKAVKFLHGAKNFLAPSVEAFIDKAAPILRKEATGLAERGASSLYSTLEHGGSPREAISAASRGMSRGFDRDALRRQLLGVGKDVVSSRYHGRGGQLGGQMGGNDAWDSFKTGFMAPIGIASKLLPFIL